MTTTLISNPPIATAESRRNEILDAIDLLIDSFDKWQADPSAGNLPTERFERALLFAAEVCESGDTPASCRELCMVTMPRLKEEWDQYVNGVRRPNHTPVPRFWAAFQALVESRKESKPYKIQIPPPVKQLLDIEKVPPEQIAWHIYGSNRQGPFIKENGSIDYALLRKEADQPGSVIPDGWVPPWEQARYDEWMNSKVRLIEASNAMSEDQPDYTDPTPIDDLLRQGQLPSVIAKIKKMKVEDVIAAAEKFGIPVPGAAPSTPAITPKSAEMDDSLQPNSVGQSDVMSAILEGGETTTTSNADQRPAATKPVEITPELRDRIVSLVSNENGVPEITEILRKDGIHVSQRQVQSVINKVS